MNEKIIIETREKIGDFIRELRKQRNITQADIAKLCDVSIPTINRVEEGKATYSIDLFFKLSVHLGFTFELAEKEMIKQERFTLINGTKTNTYEVLDSVSLISLTFEKGKFNDTQKIQFLKNNVFEPAKIATILRDLGDWVAENHADKI